MTPIHRMSRQELYDLVWSKPKIALAKDLGISDVAIGKRCKSWGIPTPGRGYWEKLEAGKPVKKVPLPDTWEEVKKKPPEPLPTSPEGVTQYSPPQETYDLHGLRKEALATLKALRKVSPSSKARVRVDDDGVFATTVTHRHQIRAAWLWNALLQAVEARGLTLTTIHGTVISDGVEELAVGLSERLRPYERTYNPRLDKTLYYRDPPATVKVDVPTGFLAFHTAYFDDPYIKRTWFDSQGKSLDDQIDKIVDGLVKLLNRKHQLRLEAEERERQRQEQRRLEQIAAEARRREKERRENLLEMAKNYDEVEIIRRFIDRLRKERSPVNGLGDYIDWADRYVDQLDPVPDLFTRLNASDVEQEPDDEMDIPSRSYI